MQPSHPSVKHLPLSKDRISNVIAEMISNFEKYAIGRKALPPLKLEKDERRNAEGFIRVGMSNIVDKIWFVEAKFGETSYGYQGIGSDYGRGLAEAESKLIVDSILEKCQLNTLTFEGDIQPSDILKSIEFLGQKHMEPRVILTNIDDHLQLWRHRNMIVHGQLGVSSSLSGFIHNIDILLCRGVPKGMSIVVDPQKIGNLFIKEAIDEVATISDIATNEREKLLKELPDLTPEKLDESVKILVYETIKAEIVESNAAAILQKKQEKEQFLFVGRD